MAKEYVMDDPHVLLTTCAAPGWDSYGAAPVTEKAVRAAASVRFCPTVDGGVQAEWHRHGWDVEVTFGPDGVLKSACFERAGENEPADPDYGL
jgi:hypothetical protein